jgi:hypothetical protein
MDESTCTRRFTVRFAPERKPDTNAMNLAVPAEVKNS